MGINARWIAWAIACAIGCGRSHEGAPDDDVEWIGDAGSSGGDDQLVVTPSRSPVCDAYEAGLRAGEALMLEILNRVLESDGLPTIGDLVHDERPEPAPLPDRDALCAGDLAPTATQAAARPCSFLLAEALDRAATESTQALNEHALDASEDYDVARAFAEGMERALGRSIDPIARALREAGTCDVDPTPATSAFEFGLAIGSRDLDDEVAAFGAELDACSADDPRVTIARQTLLANADARLRPLFCPPIEREDPGRAARREQLDAELRNGYAEGVFRAAGIASRFDCECAGP